MKCNKSKALQPIDLRPLALAALIAALFWCAQAFGATPSRNLSENGLALRGYDPVAYFVVGRAERGDAAFAATYEGATYHFASAARREAFLLEPRLYVPSYGGFCAYGVAVGQKFDGDPEVFLLVEGKLYLQLDRATQALWKADLDKNIAIADRTWPVIAKIPAAVLND
ncbi:MAG: hypothetical protein JJ959_03465 [Nisaea sp.]|uniref:YHS domain-containing (seleno)protein n=1 Tax=Nisaea sp. TaxID=2024842 RepID=UPI001B0302F6|nr:YHS domain-containing (seleno)protein [Nisaea sp.]MBO6559563.1 hypothetical protein [Nisaea sp.]